MINSCEESCNNAVEGQWWERDVQTAKRASTR